MFKSALSMLLFSCLLGYLDCTDNKPLTVKSGENAILQCNGTRGAVIVMLRWKTQGGKSELENTNKQRYVLYFRDGRTYENFQLPSFKGRAQLRDPQLKDGDLSVIINNVSMNDSGIYECYAGYDKEEPQLMSNITLTVEESGQPEGQKSDGGNEGEEKEEEGKEHGSAALIGGLVVVAVLLFAAGAVFVYFYKCRNTRTQYHGPQRQEEEEAEINI